MARKTRQRISYVLPLANEAAGHRLGVNGLALDEDRSILYSAGRDGVICAWDIDLQRHHNSTPLRDGQDQDKSQGNSSTTRSKVSSRQQLQVHTHWINDITLVQNNLGLVSASSDVSVKLWRPHAENIIPPQTIGVHADYVKCLASPGTNSDWVAAGGLDRKVRLWDLNGKGERVQIDVPDEDAKVKGSVYALAANENLVAAGGPQSVVKVWDPRSAKRVTRFVGHTDNIRAVLISEDNDKIVTASSDKTIKVWSIVAGRCMHTFSMHNDSVWCLLPGDPHLTVFYSGDRSGFVAKTDLRNVSDLDDGLSIAICQDHYGINKLVGGGDSIWTATSSSSINRWLDANTTVGVQIPDSMRTYKWTSGSRSKVSVTSASWSQPSPPEQSTTGKLPINCVLRLSNTANIPTGRSTGHAHRPSAYSTSSMKKASNTHFETEIGAFAPLRALPLETIEGQNGLIRHTMLNDKRRVLALDTAGEVFMWDLLQCTPIKSCGKRSLDEVAAEHTTLETVESWCTVDTRIGTLTCALEEGHCFDAEIYADELKEAEDIEFREDQRINLGKWILRYLFSALIEEEIRRDEIYRRNLIAQKLAKTIDRTRKPPFTIKLPQNGYGSQVIGDPGSVTTPKADGKYPVVTPGLTIGVASPSLSTNSPALTFSTRPSSVGPENNSTADSGSARGSMENRATDYFNSKPPPTSNPGLALKIPQSPSANQTEDKATTPGSPSGQEKPPAGKDGTPTPTPSSFGKRLRSTFNATRKFGRGGNTDSTKQTTAATEEKGEDSSDSRSSTAEERPVFEQGFLGVVQRLRAEYTDRLVSDMALPPSLDKPVPVLETLITPSLPSETPVLKPPPTTTIVIQEDRPESGGVMDLFEGELGNLGIQADLVEKVAPTWLADTLLRNRMPQKDITKVSFVLEPYNNLLPNVSTADVAVERLTANQMLRARKVLAYVAERLEPAPQETNPDRLAPEEYLELHCNDKTVPPKMTLKTVREQLWRREGDVVLYYKANGRKEIHIERRQAVV